MVISTKKVILDLKKDNQDLINKLKYYHCNQFNIDKSSDSVRYDSLRKNNGQSMNTKNKNNKIDKVENNIKNKIEHHQ